MEAPMERNVPPLGGGVTKCDTLGASGNTTHLSDKNVHNSIGRTILSTQLLSVIFDRKAGTVKRRTGQRVRQSADPLPARKNGRSL